MTGKPNPLKVDEVAALFRCSSKTVRKLINDGHLESQWIAGNLFVRQEDAQSYLNRNHGVEKPHARSGTGKSPAGRASIAA